MPKDLETKINEMQPEKNYGLVLKPQTPDQYILGQGNVATTPILEADEDWSDAVSNVFDEVQTQNNIDPADCTGEGLARQIAEYMYVRYGIRQKVSARWIGIIAGTRPPGNDPHVVYEAVRKNGWIPDEMLPFSSDIKTVDEYYSFKGADEAACRQAARDNLAKYAFTHEWVFNENDPLQMKIDNMKFSLTLSPLAGAWSAWYLDGNGRYIATGVLNHWVNQIGFTPENYKKLRDSYQPFDKIADQPPHFIKRINIDRIDGVPTRTIWQQLGDWLASLFSQAQELKVKQTPMPVKPTSDPVPIPLPKQESIKDTITRVANANAVEPELALSVAECESNFNPKATHFNSPHSVDWGLFQINLFYHPEVSEEQACDPEFATKWFCQMVKAGKLKTFWLASKPCWSKKISSALLTKYNV